MLSDVGLSDFIGSTHAKNWKHALGLCNSTCSDPDRKDFNIWIDTHYVEGLK